jgi:Tfp pilus assembly protein PilP
VDALPQRFQRAIEEAARSLEPKITRVELPSATIRDSEDLEKWVSEVRSRIENQLSKGPVMV